MAEESNIISAAADLVAAYVANNKIEQRDVAALIGDVHRALLALQNKPIEIEEVALVPAVSIKKSVTNDYIICLEDGKRFKSLKRHLKAFDMTPDQYRAKWGLPHDYPMTAPGYAAERSHIAKTLGLGRKRVEAVLEVAPAKAAPKKTSKAKKAKSA